MNYFNPQLSNFAKSPELQTMSQIPFKPITFERVSDIIGITYNLSNLDNISIVPLPRQNEQQIFFINSDSKIYTRTADGGIGIVGYKQEHVLKLEKELEEAQAQLAEIFEAAVSSPDTNSLEGRLKSLEEAIILLKGEAINETKRTSKSLAAVSDLAKVE